MSLPSGYTQLEYIESTGTQYIDTGVRPTVNTSFQFGIYMLEQTGWVIVENMVNDNNDYRIFNYSGEVYWDLGSGRLTGTDGSFPVNKKFDFKVGNNYVDRNGKRILTGSKVTAFTADSNILVFRGEQVGNSKGRIYYLKIWEESAVVRDFVPCRNAAGRVGLWDSVSGTFYGNAGAGDFVAGPAYLGTHTTLVNGTAYEVKSGKCLVNGTAYSVKKGRTLIGGTGYDVALDRKLKVTITGIGNATYAWVEIDGVRYTGPATVEVDEQTAITCYAKTSYPMSDSGIYINNTLVVATSVSGDYSAVYNIDVTADMSIELVYGTVGLDYLRGSVYITK